MSLIRNVTTFACLMFLFNSCMANFDYQTSKTMELNQNWQFQMKGESTWLPATVPGCVQTDLQANNKIQDPFYRTNEKDIQWIDKKDWIYKCTFQIDSKDLESKKIEILFKGLDTYAHVKINNQPVLDANNMFRSWKTDIKKFLKTGDNTLEIEFPSPVKIGLEKLDQNGYGLPASNDLSEIGEIGDKKISVFTRKAPYQYGWDWGPRIVTIGIWRPVEIVFSNNAKIEDVYYNQIDISSDKALINAQIEITSPDTGKYSILLIAENGRDKIETKKEITIIVGENTISIPLEIPKPKLWWPNGMGDQNLYKIQLSVLSENKILDTLTKKIGLRSVKLIQEPDSLGKSFYFEVNGLPVFAKGANYIPNDNFLDKVSNERYEYILKSAVDANMNMLRVWGGGIYENDIFYELCDKYGLLLWQDFMFACSMYPGDPEFLDNVKAEVTENVKRLRNHASIVLWCGNNEIDAAWCQGDPDCGWGWKQRYNKDQLETVWHSYDTLFHKIIPAAIEELDNSRSYWPSSPITDWGVHSTYNSTSGDMHYWGVWHSNEPFDAFYNHIGRFMSEYGFQSFPDMQTIKKFTLPEDLEINSEIMRWHQRSGYGNQRILDYMKALYPIPDKFESILYVSQVMQAEAIKQAINAHRAKKPFCMGTLYWQLNDCWPVASWSSIDYYGHWKALHYFTKKAYKPVTLSFVPDGDSVALFVNNDTNSAKEILLKYSIIDFNGRKLQEETVQSIVVPDRSNKIKSFNLKEIRTIYKSVEIFLFAEIIENGKTIYSDNYYFEIPKELNLPEPKVNYTLSQKDNTLFIKLEAENLIRNLYVSIPEMNVQFNDNYFDLLPGEQKIISCSLPDKSIISKESVKLISVNDILKDQ